MASELHRSGTTDGEDVNSKYDRYSVTHGIRRSKDGEESNANKSVSFQHLSVASSSFDSRTYGTSIVSDGSETLERDEFFDDEEFLNLDNLSLESQPMVIDRFVDSACSCLDHPVVLYQQMCLGRETSLLRQSKVRSPPSNFNNRPTSPTSGMTAARPRSYLVRGNNVYSKGEVDEGELSPEHEKRNEIQIMRIQPKEVFEFKDVARPKPRKYDNHTTRREEGKETLPSNSREMDMSPRSEPTLVNKNRREGTYDTKQIDLKKEANEEPPSISSGDTKSMVERAIQKVAKEDKERDANVRLLDTVTDTGDVFSQKEEAVDLEVKIDPPSGIHEAATRDGQSTDTYSANHLKLELSSSDDRSKDLSKTNENLNEVAMDPSGRGQRTESQIMTTHRIAEVASETSNIIQSRSKETEIASDDETSLFNDLDVIDVFSMDDQDSWIPGSRNEIDNYTRKNMDELLHDKQNSSLSASKEAPRSIDNEGKGDHPITTTSSSVNELWDEEEEKLNSNTPSNEAKPSQPNIRAVTQTAEDLWNEERMKLQTAGDAFENTSVREVLLRQHQGNLRNGGVDARQILQSQSRRQRIRNALKGRDAEDFLSYKISQEKLRAKSLGLNPPAPENTPDIQQGQNDSFKHSLGGKAKSSQPKARDSSNVTPLPSRKKDLVAVRSIEEGQRIRSSKRNAPKKYDTHSYRKPSLETRNYTGKTALRAPYDERSNQSSYHSNQNPMIKSSNQQIMKTRDPTGRKRLTNFENPARNYQLKDERDDQESLNSSNPVESRPAVSTSEKRLSDYEVAISATKELRKLEKKIERQLRRADLDSKADQSKEIRRIEKKLSKKLRSIKSDDMDAEAVSPREIRRLEKQLAQNLSSENENRASKLKRIKRKGGTSARSFTSSPMRFKDVKDISAQVPSSYSGHNLFHRNQVDMITPAPPSKSFSEDSQENPPERYSHEYLKVHRSRYLGRGKGRRMYSKVTDSD